LWCSRAHRRESSGPSCERIEYGNSETRRYLASDLALSCDSDEYKTAYNVALVMLFVWPVGIPLLYAILLWASRHALRKGIDTSLSRATAFLSDDYDYGYWTPLAWWKPLEMCRKLTLTGARII